VVARSRSELVRAGHSESPPSSLPREESNDPIAIASLELACVAVVNSEAMVDLPGEENGGDGGNCSVVVTVESALRRPGGGGDREDLARLRGFCTERMEGRVTFCGKGLGEKSLGREAGGGDEG